MTKYDVLIMVVIVVLVTSLLGGVWGYTVDGVPNSPDGETNVLVDAVGFFIDMITFQIDNVPIWISAVFLGLNLLMLYLCYNAIRGNG